MSVIIRLQNLPWSANALDIRQYFHGLSIPEGGVHIVGGEQGDAFIAFSTDEDARQAMMADGGKIKEVKLKLLLSSRAEMMKVIETARMQTISLQNFMNMPTPQQPTPPLPPPPQPSHMLGSGGVLGHLHLPHGPASQHILAANIPAQHSPVHQAIPHPHHPAAQQVASSGPLQHASEKKESDRRVDRGDKKRDRSRSRSRERRRNSRESRDKDRDRHRGNRRRSRSRSRDRRRRDRSRDRSKSRERRDRRRNDKDGKDNKDKQNGNDIVVVGQFAGRAGSKDERPRPPKSQSSQPAVLNGSQQSSSNVGNAPGWPNSAPAPGSTSPAPRQSQDHPGGMPPGGRMPGNFPPGAPFTFPGNQEQGWMPPRQPGMIPPQQGRFDGGGFRGGPPGRPNSSRFEERQGGPGPGPEFPHDGPFPPRGRDRPPFDEGFRGGHRGGFNPRDNNSRGQRSAPHTCVEIRNVPASAAYRDIREFFQGMHVLNIKMINDEQGRKTGIAYIKFTTLDQKEAALSMNGMTVHDSHLEILHLDDQIYDDALDSFHPNAETHIVALHGLPPYANEQDIRRLFQGARILNVVMSRANSPRSPQAYVQFSTQQEGRRAIQASGKLTVEGKEIFVERSSIETLLNSKKLEQEMGPADPIVEKQKEKPVIIQRKENSAPLSSDVVLLKNLPLNVNDRAILDFFSDVGLVPQRIHIMLDKTNSPFGDAFCEFLNVSEGTRALAKNNNMLGSKEISVKTVTRIEMEKSLGILEQKHLDDNKHPLPLQRPPMPAGPPRNGPMPPHPDHMRHMGGPPMRGGHMGEFMGRGGGRGGFFGDMRGGPHMRGHRGMHHGGPPMMVRPPHMPPQQMQPPPDGPTLDTFGTPGCVIELQNVPYKAEIEEIIDYFEGFDVAPANIIRRFNDAGLPTGDARVSFRSPAEAQRALEDLKFKTMRDRPIYISII